MPKKKLKVLCAMSGGVDSSVAAALLQKQGYEVVGIFMKFWSEPTTKGVNSNKCCSIEAYSSAKKVAQILDIPLYTVNFKDAFKKKIVNNFLEEYQIGLTPNPCVRCNQFIKFGLLLDKARQYGARYIATGHYARKIINYKLQITNKSQIPNYKSQTNEISKFKLLKGKDKNKDQTYFLYTLNQKKLKSILFPCGNYTKPEIRKLAKKFKLPVAEKSESQEICFVGEDEHYGFLRRNLKLKKGDIVSVDGENLGKHQGLPLYTIGQRRGIEIGGTGPYYVVELDFKNNQLIVANDNQHPALMRDFLICKNVNWVSGSKPDLPLKCRARVRYRQEEAEAVITLVAKNSYQVKFKKPQRAITPGQSVVFYKRSEVLGGGIIVR